MPSRYLATRAKAHSPPSTHPSPPAPFAMSAATPNPLFKVLLGRHETVEHALNEASKRIASIGARKPRGFRSVKQGGASFTRLYDYEVPGIKSSQGSESLRQHES